MKFGKSTTKEKLRKEIGKLERKLKQRKIDLPNEEAAYKSIIDSRKQGIKSREAEIKFLKGLI